MRPQPESRRNATFAISDFPEEASAWPVPSCGWADELLKLSGPELYRVPIPAELASGASGTLQAWAFLREWGKLWTKEGSGLTTRVSGWSMCGARGSCGDSSPPPLPPPPPLDSRSGLRAVRVPRQARARARESLGSCRGGERGETHGARAGASGGDDAPDEHVCAR